MVTEPHAPDDRAVRPAGAGRVARSRARRADRRARRHETRAPRGVSAAGATCSCTSTRLRDQIAAPARTILLVLLAAAAVVFVIACSNVANLILARSVRREGELAVRAALGASRGALRRTLLAESLVLCGAGAVLGVLLARPFVSRRRALRRALLRPRARRHRRRQRALGRRGPGDGRGRAARLRPAAAVAAGAARDSGWRAAASASRPARTAACACSRRRRSRSRSCCSPAPACCSRRSSRCRRRTPATTCAHVLAFDIPPSATGVVGDAKRGRASIEEATRRIAPAAGRRRRGRRQLRALARRRQLRSRRASSRSRATRRPTAKRTRARGCGSSRPGFFAVLGVPLLAGRDFTDDDRDGSEPVVIVSQSVAQRLFPNGDALNRQHVVDRSVLRQARARAASSASSPTWTTRTSCAGRR